MPRLTSSSKDWVFRTFFLHRKMIHMIHISVSRLLESHRKPDKRKRWQAERHTYIGGFMHYDPICPCEPRAAHCDPSCNFWGPFVHHFMDPSVENSYRLGARGYSRHPGVSQKTYMELCTMVYNSKNGAQCDKWCTNAPIFIWDSAQMPLRRSRQTDNITLPLLLTREVPRGGGWFPT